MHRMPRKFLAPSGDQDRKMKMTRARTRSGANGDVPGSLDGVSVSGVPISRRARRDEGRAVDLNRIAELRTGRDVVRHEPTVDECLGATPVQVLQRISSERRGDASMPPLLVHVGVGERNPSTCSLVGETPDDPAIDQRLVEAGRFVFAHHNGGR